MGYIEGGHPFPLEGLKPRHQQGSTLLTQSCCFKSVACVMWKLQFFEEQTDLGRELHLTLDLIDILTVFASRLYGARSRKNLCAVATSVSA